MFGLSNIDAQQMIWIYVIALIPALPNLWAIWHAFRRNFPTVNEKMIWIAAAVFVPIIGGLAYIFFGRKRGQLPE
ncbi:PLDc N-terminal domain-containing protein [Desulfovibrio inopinatus]|uniref:PLDc N-terminal domain-containing protein n=1 Tax=Desulfovibrio inopinatus TaxID=102109 RepID=UPI000404F20E|nr:PLDc N-terminal domain-containing protein [Desulfovibrio inopinatus]